MSLPSAVFLDTSVLAGQQYNFSSTALTTFAPLAKARALTLLLPDPTEREINRQINERSQEALHALDEARRKAPFLAKWQHFPKQKSSVALTNWEVRRIALAELADFFEKFKVQKLAYEHIEVKQVMAWYDEILAPFREGKKRKEFPDAFAIAIVDSYARRTGSTVAVVSDDTDIKLACDRFPHLLYFKSLPAFTELLLASDGKIEELRAAILNDVSQLETAIFNSATTLDSTHTRDEFVIEDTHIHGATLLDVRIVAIGSNECTLTFEAAVEAEYSLVWLEWTYDHEEQVTENKSVIENCNVTGTAKVALDAKHHGISQITFLEIDQQYLEVTEDPRRRW